MLLDEIMAEVDRRASARNHEVIRAVLRTESIILPFICAHCYHLSRLVKARKELSRLEGECKTYDALWRREKHSLGLRPVWLVTLETQIADLKSAMEDDKLAVSLTERCGECRACRSAAQMLVPQVAKTRRVQEKPPPHTDYLALWNAPLHTPKEPPPGDPDNPTPYGRDVSRVLSPDAFEFIPEGGEGE